MDSPQTTPYNFCKINGPFSPAVSAPGLPDPSITFIFQNAYQGIISAFKTKPQIQNYAHEIKAHRQWALLDHILLLKSCRPHCFLLHKFIILKEAPLFLCIKKKRIGASFELIVLRSSARVNTLFEIFSNRLRHLEKFLRRISLLRHFWAVKSMYRFHMIYMILKKYWVSRPPAAGLVSFLFSIS